MASGACRASCTTRMGSTTTCAPTRSYGVRLGSSSSTEAQIAPTPRVCLALPRRRCFLRDELVERVDRTGNRLNTLACLGIDAEHAFEPALAKRPKHCGILLLIRSADPHLDD